MTRLSPISLDKAEGKAKDLLTAVKAKLGGVPNLLATFANAPAALQGYLGLSEAVSGGVLDAKQREQIALAVAGINGCDYCASAHTAIGKGAGLNEAQLSAALGGEADDPKTAAILKFATAVVDAKGLVSDGDVAEFRAAGGNDEEIAEIVANVALNIYTNYFNLVSGTEVDFPLVKASPARAAA